MRIFLVLTTVTLAICNTQCSGYQPDYPFSKTDFQYFRHRPFFHQMKPSLALPALYIRPLQLSPDSWFSKRNGDGYRRGETGDPNGRFHDMFYQVDNEPGYQSSLRGRPQPLFMPSKLYRSIIPLRESKNENENSLSTTDIPVMGPPAVVGPSSESDNEDDVNSLTTTDISVSGLTEDTDGYNDSENEPVI